MAIAKIPAEGWRLGLEWRRLNSCRFDSDMRNKKLPANTQERLLRAARKAMKNAYAPFSNFRVGAAILTAKGEIFAGCNVENSSYGMTNCAERTAIFSAVAASGPKLEVLAVAVTNAQGVPCSPCGACRQVIYEFGPDAVVLYQGKDGLQESHITELLPEGFRFK
jgi:cytidine deaminase